MTKEELIAKLNDIEWEDFEVKEARAEVPKSVWETVSAFSNTSGGWLIFGVRKKGRGFTITGVKNPEKIEQDFTNTLRGDKFNVKITPDCRKYDFPEGIIIAFYIPISDKKPVYFNALSNTFIRTASGDQRATKPEIDSMFRDQAFGTKDKELTKYSFEDLHKSTIESYKSFLRITNPGHRYNKLGDVELLEKLQVIKDGKITIGGLLVFGKYDNVEDLLIDFRVDYLEIPGTSYSDAEVRFTYRISEEEKSVPVLFQYHGQAFQKD